MRIAFRSSCVHQEASLCQSKVSPHTSCCLSAHIPVSSRVHNHCMISVSWKEFCGDSNIGLKLDITDDVKTRHPLTRHICAVQSVHERRNASHALGSGIACHLCAPKKNLTSGQHMSHLLLFSHLPFTTSTSSSSFTLLTTTTQEHAVQSGQHDLLQEHPVHHAHPQALQVEHSAINNHPGVKTCRVLSQKVNLEKKIVHRV